MNRPEPVRTAFEAISHNLTLAALALAVLTVGATWGAGADLRAAVGLACVEVVALLGLGKHARTAGEEVRQQVTPVADPRSATGTDLIPADAVREAEQRALEAEQAAIVAQARLEQDTV